MLLCASVVAAGGDATAADEPDLTAPVVTSVSWPAEHGSVLIGLGGNEVALDVAVSDDRPGLLGVNAQFEDPANGSFGWIRLSGWSTDPSTSSAVVRVTGAVQGDFIPSGSYLLERVVVGDQAHNSTSYFWDGRKVTNTADGHGVVEDNDLDMGNVLTVRTPYPGGGHAEGGDTVLHAMWLPAVDADGAAPSSYTVGAIPWCAPDNIVYDCYSQGFHSTEPVEASVEVPGGATSADIAGLRNAVPYAMSVTAHLPDGGSWTYVNKGDQVWTEPVLSISPLVVVPEGDSDNGAAVFTVRVSNPAATPIGFGFYADGGTATPDVDYRWGSGWPVDDTVRIEPGQASAELRIPVYGDAAAEPDEDFYVTLRGCCGVHATLGETVAHAVILDDDPGDAARVSVGSVTSIGGKSGTARAVFTVRLLRPVGHRVTVHYRTLDGTAIGGHDYRATHGVLTFRPGQTTRYVPITTIGLRHRKHPVRFTLRLSNAAGATIRRAEGSGRILR